MRGLNPEGFCASCLSSSIGAQMATLAEGSFMLQLFGFTINITFFCKTTFLYDSSVGKGFL